MFFKKPPILFVILIFFVFSGLAASAPHNFNQAKKIAKLLFGIESETLYCACKYDEKYRVDLHSCNMESASAHKRAHRIEFEHMMPAENFGRQFKCWRELLCHDRKGKPFKGRKCCQRIDENYRKAEAELYNLWPAVGLVNQARSNYRFSPLPTKKGFYGCDFNIDKTLRKVEPSDRAKGIVARANLFMSNKYHLRLSPAQQKLFDAWSHQFPPKEEEKKWAKKVEEIEGYSNPYILYD